MYNVVIKNQALKQLEKLPLKTLEAIHAKILLLEINPRPDGCKKLKSFAGAVSIYRVRVGDYRVIYTVEDNVLTVIIVKIGHRSEVYMKQTFNLPKKVERL